MARTVLFFDLDDTLAPERAAVDATFAATCALAARRRALDSQRLARSVREHARRLWRAFKAHDYCVAIGVGSTEGLWGRFDGDDPNLRALHDWVPTYRLEAWTLGLADVGVDDGALAAELAAEHARQRALRHVPFPEAAPLLARLRGHYGLALLTNGAPDVQRTKLCSSGLQEYFESVIVSGELGVGKPAPAVFEHAMRSMNAAPSESVMIGDSARRDIAGAQQAGMKAIWTAQSGIDPDPDVTPDARIDNLDELEARLREIGHAPGACTANTRP